MVQSRELSHSLSCGNYFFTSTKIKKVSYLSKKGAIMKKQLFIQYLFLATLAFVPLETQAYFGYPSDRSRDQDDNNQSNQNYNNNYNSNYNSNSNNNWNNNNDRNFNDRQNPSKLQQPGRDYSKSRQDRDLAQNDDDNYDYEQRERRAQIGQPQNQQYNQQKRDINQPVKVYDDSHDFEIRNQDYRDRLYYEEHKK
jgi:hypothetical protein